MSDRKKRRTGYTPEDIQNMPREELESLVLQLSAHNDQLQALLKRTLAASAGGITGNGHHQGDDKSNKKQKSQQRSFDFSRYKTRHILLKFAYLGWDYQGYAVQEDTLNTIEHVLFAALNKTKLVEDRQTSNYHRCGRTDKGVSAFSQVISLTVRSKANSTADCLPAPSDELSYVDILNRVLPKELRAIAWCPAPSEYSARFNCTSRTYKYFFPRGALNVKRMNEAAQYMLGTHDFRNLCKMDVGNGVVNFIRSVDRVSISDLQDELNSEVYSPLSTNTSEINTRIAESNSTQQNCNEKDSEASCRTSVNRRDNSQCDNSDLEVGNMCTRNSSIISESGSSRSEDKGCDNQPKGSFSQLQSSCSPDGYSMCVATIKSKAFLWHQVRAIMAVLLLVGEGKEEPEVVRELLDVSKHPCKPQYSLASEVPLCLFEVEYDSKELQWHYSQDTIKRLVKDMQLMWAQHSIRGTMLRTMLHHLTGVDNTPSSSYTFSSDQHLCLSSAPPPKVYKPLLHRDTCESLEEKVRHYVKRRRLDSSVLESVQSVENSARDLSKL